MRNFVQNRFRINAKMMRKIIMFRRNPTLGTCYNFFQIFIFILRLHATLNFFPKFYDFALAKVGGPKLTYNYRYIQVSSFMGYPVFKIYSIVGLKYTIQSYKLPFNTDFASHD